MSLTSIETLKLNEEIAYETYCDAIDRQEPDRYIETLRLAWENASIDHIRALRKTH